MTIPSWAVRGAKVVCILDDWDTAHTIDPMGVMAFPKKDEIYTIREVRVRFVSEWSEVMVGVLVVEISNPVSEAGSATGEEFGFDIRCFRPLVQKDEEIEAQIYQTRRHRATRRVGEDA